MASYLDLVEQAMLLQRAGNAQRYARLASGVQTGVFERLFSSSLQNLQVSAQPPVNSSVLDLSMPKDDAANFQKGFQFVLEKEGAKLVREDGGRESSKYGILQSTARAFGFKGDIKNMTREGAEMIYRKLWDKSGAASLPFPLSVVHFDTYINSPAAAKRLLQRSNGDINTYLKLREQRYVRLATAKPEVYGKYLQGWKNRIQSLKSMVAAYEAANKYAQEGTATKAAAKG